jgi:GDP-L-fucose synthase
MPILEFFIESNVKYRSYNIVPDEKVSLLKVAEMVKEISGKDIEIKIGQTEFGLDYTGDNSRLKQEFKQNKFLKMEQSVEILYNYYKSNKIIINRNILLEDK